MRGDLPFREKLRRLSDHLRNLRPLYKSWGIVTLKWVMQNYRSGGAKVGGWRKLRPLTLKSRRKRSNKPLMNTGHLLKQWNYRLRPWGVAVGNPSEIAAYHEEGTGPYTIKPKGSAGLFRRKAKVLWFGVTPAQRRRGQDLGGRMSWRVKSKPYKSWGRRGAPGIFAREVHHPGLPARRQLPKEREIMPDLKKTADVWLNKVVK